VRCACGVGSCVRACARVRTCGGGRLRVYVCTRAAADVCVRACVHVRRRKSACVRVRVCGGGRLRACVCACAAADVCDGRLEVGLELRHPGLGLGDERPEHLGFGRTVASDKEAPSIAVNLV
jgi:hypothetical protein